MSRLAATSASAKPRGRASDIVESFHLGAASEPAAATEIDPGDRSLLSANDHPDYLRRVRQHRLRPQPRSVAVDGRHPRRRRWRRSGASRRSTRFSTIGMKWWPTRRCAAWSADSTRRPGLKREGPRSYAAPMRSPSRRPRIHIRPGRYWEHESSSLPRTEPSEHSHTEQHSDGCARGSGSARCSPPEGIPT